MISGYEYDTHTINEPFVHDAHELRYQELVELERQDIAGLVGALALTATTGGVIVESHYNKTPNTIEQTESFTETTSEPIARELGFRALHQPTSLEKQLERAASASPELHLEAA